MRRYTKTAVPAIIQSTPPKVSIFLDFFYVAQNAYICVSQLQIVMRRLLTYLTVSIISVLTLSCGKDNVQEDEKNSFVLERADIIGCWKVIQAKYDETATMMAWSYEDTYVTFEENGLYKCEGYFGNSEGTYSVSGNVITTKVDNVPSIIYEVTGLEDGKVNLTATLQSNQMKIWVVVEKADDADAFVGTWNVSVVEHVVWGYSSGTLTDTGTLIITKISASRVQTSGYFRTQGEVVGNVVYFEATHSSDSAGYMDNVFGPATLNGNVITVTGNTTGQLKDNGIAYPFRRTAEITMIRKQ